MPNYKYQRGFAPLLVLMVVSVLGLLSFVFVTNTVNFNSKLFGSLFPKLPSQAASAPVSSPTTPAPTSTPAARFVNITYPNGGESLTAGQTVKIIWEGNDIDAYNIGYSYGPGSLNWIATGLTGANLRSYDWVVNVGNKTTATQVKIQIIAYKTGVGSVQDLSDNFFTVMPTSTPTPIPSASPLVISRVDEFSVTTSSALIKWSTDYPGTSQVMYGTSPQNLNLTTTLDSTLVTTHSVQLANLNPKTKYFYKVYSKNAVGTEYSYSSNNSYFTTK